jgi:hypothetical protein
MYNDSLRKAFHNAYIADTSYSEIISTLGISLRTILYWRDDMGLPQRKTGPKSEARWRPPVTVVPRKIRRG